MKFYCRVSGKQFNILAEHIGGAIYEARDIMFKQEAQTAELYDVGKEASPRVVLTDKDYNTTTLTGTMRGLFGD